jgi:hypothetical protein
MVTYFKISLPVNLPGDNFRLICKEERSCRKFENF